MSPAAEKPGSGPGENVVKPPSHGKIWAPLTAGEVVGKPLAEWAYVTPRFPRGIKNTDLQYVDLAIQRETALWWFYLNLEPYDLTKGGPYFGFSGAIGSAPIGALAIGGGQQNIGGFDQAPFASSPVAALDALSEEFGGIIVADILEELGQALGSRWMWIRPPTEISFESTTDEVLSSLRST